MLWWIILRSPVISRRGDNFTSLAKGKFFGSKKKRDEERHKLMFCSPLGDQKNSQGHLFTVSKTEEEARLDKRLKRKLRHISIRYLKTLPFF